MHQIRVESVAYVHEIPPTLLLSFQEYLISADLAQTVYNGEGWSSSSLEQESFTMVGHNKTGHWFTYLRFSLDTIPSNTTFSEAFIKLALEENQEIPPESFFIDIYVVNEESLNSETLTWDQQPKVAQAPIGRVEIMFENDNNENYYSEDIYDEYGYDEYGYDEYGYDEYGYEITSFAQNDLFDVTHYMNEIIANGHISVTFLLLPSDPTALFQRSWVQETFGLNGPILELTVGPPPPELTQAQQETLTWRMPLE